MGADLPRAETATLLAEHQALVAKVKAAASEVIPSGGVTEDGVVVDDLFFLRFLLSNKLDTSKASFKAIETLNWRKTNAALLKVLANGGKHPVHDRISMSLFQGNCGKLNGGEPVSIVRMGVSDFRNLMNTFSVEEVAEYLLYEKEAVFRMCDSETRKRGYLVKSVTVIDFAHFTMFGRRFDKRFFEALGQSSKRSSVLFPQLQVKTVAINTPAYYGMVHKTLSAVMPKSSMEKMVMCPAKKTETQSASKCPFLAANGGVDQVPPFLGGTGAIPRSATPIHERTGEHPFQVVKVKSRSFAVIEMMIEQRDTMVEFEVKVDSYHVYMRAEVRTAREGDLERLLSRTTTMMSASSDDDPPKVEMHKRGRRNRWKTSRAREVPELDRKMSMVGPPPANSKRLSLNPQLTPLKLQAKDGLVKGTWRIPVAGRLLIAFDNTFSRFRSKTITYRILSVPTPEDEEEKSWWESNWGEFASQAKWPLAKDDDWSCVVS